MNRKYVIAGVVLLAGSAAAADRPPVEVIGGLPLPGVSASVVSREDSRASSERELTASAGQAPVELRVRSGVTELLPIARGYLNQVNTPFESPKLITVNPLDFRKEGSTLFLTTSSARPVGVHIISNDEDDRRSISLALVPRAIPPQTISLRWREAADGAVIATSMRTRAKRWEESTPYQDTLIGLAEAVARHEIPQGYSLAEAVNPLPCALPGIEFVTGQRLAGSHLSTWVLKATNVSGGGIEILGDAGCRLPGVRLVATWPRAYLEPGEATEVYVTMANEALARPATAVRPSLLNSGD